MGSVGFRRSLPAVCISSTLALPPFPFFFPRGTLAPSAGLLTISQGTLVWALGRKGRPIGLAFLLITFGLSMVLCSVVVLEFGNEEAFAAAACAAVAAAVAMFTIRRQ